MDTISITIDNKTYGVPPELTIMKAMEHAGFQFVHGCGCRGGVCGACGFVYRKKGSNDLHSGLACQTVVELDMLVSQIHFFPANKAIYDVEKISPEPDTIVNMYPEILTCLGCNSCTNICPQDLDVMGYVAAAIQGDYEKLNDKSFECIMCGLCVSRCPRDLVQPFYAILGRRLYAREHKDALKTVKIRIKEITGGMYEKDYRHLKSTPQEEFKDKYLQLQSNKEPD